MKNMQYTIRSIPPKLDSELRRKATRTGKSLNQVIVDTLSKGIGLSNEDHVHKDLDWFIGSAIDNNKQFDDSLSWLNSLPSNLDKNS